MWNFSRFIYPKARRDKLWFFRSIQFIHRRVSQEVLSLSYFLWHVARVVFFFSFHFLSSSSRGVKLLESRSMSWYHHIKKVSWYHHRRALKFQVICGTNFLIIKLPFLYCFYTQQHFRTIIRSEITKVSPIINTQWKKFTMTTVCVYAMPCHCGIIVKANLYGKIRRKKNLPSV